MLPAAVDGSARGKIDRALWQGFTATVFGRCITKGCFAEKNPYFKKYFLGEHGKTVKKTMKVP